MRYMFSEADRLMNMSPIFIILGIVQIIILTMIGLYFYRL